MRWPRLNPDHSPLGVGRQSTFRLVQQDEFVAKGITNAGTPADRNIEWRLNALAACAQETRESLVDIGDQNVRLGSDLQVNDKLRVCLGKGEANCFIASPKQAMTELVAIKGDRRVKIGDAKQMIVEFSKQGCFKAHFKETPMDLTRTGRPHRSQVIVSVGSRMSDRVSEPSRGTLTTFRWSPLLQEGHDLPSALSESASLFVVREYAGYGYVSAEELICVKHGAA